MELKDLKELDKRGFALMRSGSYVVGVKYLDKKKWIWKLEDFKKHTYSFNASIVVTNDQNRNDRGKLARFAFLSEDKKFAKYYGRFGEEPSYVPLSFIYGKAYEPEKFLKMVKERNEMIHVQKVLTKTEWCGMLFCADIKSYKKSYSSLVVLANTPIGFDLIDLEFKKNPHNSGELVKSIKHPPGMSQVFRQYGLC